MASRAIEKSSVKRVDISCSGPGSPAFQQTVIESEQRSYNTSSPQCEWECVKHAYILAVKDTVCVWMSFVQPCVYMKHVYVPAD